MGCLQSLKMWHNLKLTFALGLFLFLTGHLTYSADGISRSLQFDDNLCGVENVQVLWLQDGTIKTYSQLTAINAVLKHLQSDLSQLSDASDLAIALFTDRQNNRMDTDWTDDSQMCYRRYTNFTDDTFDRKVDDLRYSVHRMKPGFDGDERNSQVLALYYGILDKKVGWLTSKRSEDFKVVIIMTHSLFHEWESNPGPGEIELQTQADHPCGTFNPPTFKVLVEAFKYKKTGVIFVVAHDFRSDHVRVVHEYVQLSKALKSEGIRSAIIDVGKDISIHPASLLNNVKKAISDVACGKARRIPEAPLFLDYNLCGVDTVQALWLHDVSGAMQFQHRFIRKVFIDLRSRLLQMKSSNLAISLFTDKPSIVGNQTDEGKCYHNVAKFDIHEAQFNWDVTHSLSFRVGTGGDKKEAQLLALLYGVMDNEIGWQENNGPDDLKVVILMTDSLYHEEGDSSDTPASIDDILSPCEEVDYPSFNVLARAFQQKNAVVIFVVTEHFNGDLEHAEHVQQYERLGRAMKIKYAVVDVGVGKYPEPTSLLDKVQKAISEVACGRTYKDGAIEEGAIEEGAIEEGAIEEGAIEEGAMEEGAMEEGAMEEGAIEEGATNEGATNEGKTKIKSNRRRNLPTTCSLRH